jgi:hypothetical protein
MDDHSDNQDTPDKARQAAASPDMPRHAAADHGLSRQAAASPDIPRQEVPTDRDLSDYTMTVEEALTRFEQAGVRRDKRTVERYCEHSKIDAVKVFGAFGPTWRLNPESVEGKIKNLQKQLAESGDIVATTTPDNEVRQATTDHGLSRHAAASPDMSGPVAASEAPMSHPVAPPDKVSVLEDENQRLRQENTDLKKDYLDVKIDNRGLTQTVVSLTEEIKEFGKERREMQSERKSFMAQIGDLTMRLGLLAAGRERTPTEPIQATIIHDQPSDTNGAPEAASRPNSQPVDKSGSEIST